MNIAHWVVEHWKHLAENIGLLSGLVVAAISFHIDAKVRKVEMYFRIIENYRSIWVYLYSRAELAGIRDPNRDTVICPPTDEEVHSVNFLLFQLNGSLLATKAGILPGPERLADDVRSFFALPSAKFAWKRLRSSHDKKFVAFVERCLDQKGPSA